MASEYDLALFIGRFRPWHLEHQRILATALEWAGRVLILVGSSGGPPTPRNPFSFAEVARMIRESNLTAHEDGRIVIEPSVDTRYNNEQWLRDVNAAVERTLLTGPGHPFGRPRVALVGHDKQDGTGEHHKWFPQYGVIPLASASNQHASVIRQQYFMLGDQYVRHCDGLGGQDGSTFTADVTTPVRLFLQEFMQTPIYKSLCAEVEFNHRYRLRLKSGEFPNQPNTADALVYHETGHVLLVKRKDHPGKGLWAIPGGFVNETETRLECALRELVEETEIDVPLATLRSLVVAKEDFDDIHRDARARIFTLCYLIRLRAGVLPKVSGKSDAAEAQWWNIGTLRREAMFADHHDIIIKMLGRL